MPFGLIHIIIHYRKCVFKKASKIQLKVDIILDHNCLLELSVEFFPRINHKVVVAILTSLENLSNVYEKKIRFIKPKCKI